MMYKSLVSSVLLGTTVLSVSCFASSFNSDFLSNERHTIVSDKMEQHEEMLKKCTEALEELTQEKKDFQRKPHSAVDQGGNIIPTNLTEENRNEAFGYLAQLQSFDHKLTVLKGDISRSKRKTQKYSGLKRLYSNLSLLNVIDSLKEKTKEHRDFSGMAPQPNMYSQLEELSIHNLFAYLSSEQGRLTANFDIQKGLIFFGKSFNNLPTQINKIFDIDSSTREGQKRLETFGKDVNGFQFDLRNRHEFLSKKVEDLSKEADMLSKNRNFALQNIQRSNTVTLLPNGNNPLTVALFNSGSQYFSVTPIDSKSQKESLKLAEDQVDYQTAIALKQVNAKLEKADKELSALQKISSFFDELYIDLLKNSKLS